MINKKYLDVLMKKNSGSFLIDTLKYVPVKILPAIAGLLSVYILTENFSKENYIDYTFLISSILLVGQLFNGWLNSTIIYFFPNCKTFQEEYQFVNDFFSIQLVFQFLGFCVLFSVIYAGLGEIKISLFASLLFLVQGSIVFISSILQSKRKIKAQVLSTMIQAILHIISLILMVYFFKDNLVVYLILYIISFIVSLLILLSIHKENGYRFRFNIVDKAIVNKVLQYGLPICIWIFSVQFYSTGDRILFKFLNINENVVNYIAFKDLAIGLSGFISMPLLLASHPIIMNMVIKEKDFKGAVFIIERNINILLMLFLPCILVVYFYGEYLIGLVLGEKYLLSPIMMVMILLTVLASCISIYLQKGLEVGFKTKEMLYVALFVVLFSMLSNLVFIPLYGAYASIIIGFLSQLLYCFLIYYKSKKVMVLSIKEMNILFFVFIILISIIMKESFDINNYSIFSFVLLTIVFCFKKLNLVRLMKK